MARIPEKKEPKREERREAKLPFGKRKAVEAAEARGFPAKFKKGGAVRKGC